MTGWSLPEIEAAPAHTVDWFLAFDVLIKTVEREEQEKANKGR